MVTQPLGYENIYYVYRLHPHGETDLHRVLIGKFMLSPEGFHVLEDHVGWLEKLEKESPEEVARTIHALSQSMYYQVVNLEDIRQGHHPDLVKELPAGGDDSAGPQSSFVYHRQGMAKPQTLEFISGKAYLDGHSLSDEELQVLLDNVQGGSATLGYTQDLEPIEKAEAAFMTLAKIEPHLEQALQGLREAVKAGHIDPKVLKALTGEIFTDSMVKRMGNKKAYADFLSRPKQGVHIRMDGNDFGQINKTHGFETGNQAIAAMGNAIREAMDETTGAKQGKTFRIGGDEFHAFVPSHEHAALFARSVRNKLEQVPAVGGTHNLSLSIGMGHTPDHAELAMINAKGAKKAAGYQPGQAKTHAASQVPGFEGHIPTGPDQLNLKPLPAPEPTPVPVHVSAPVEIKPPVSVQSAQGSQPRPATGTGHQ